MKYLSEDGLSTLVQGISDNTYSTIIPAVLNACGKRIINYSIGDTYKYGDVVKRTQTLQDISGETTTTVTYYYYNGSKLNVITPALLKGLLKADSIFSYPMRIPKTYWSTATPFKDNCGYLKNVAKGETVFGETKWYLQLEEDSENQLFTAGTTKDAKYYGSFQFIYGRDMGVWELWLPSTLSTGSVIIDY